MSRRALPLAGALALAAAAPAAAQQSQPLGRPVAEYAEPFSRVSGLRELADGRVVVSDMREKLVHLVDLQRQVGRTISREGSGPGEYAMPTTLLALPNDQTLLVDLLNRRFLVIKPDGTPGETISPPQLGGGGEGVLIGGLVNARAADAQGRLYFQDLGIRPGQPAPDSVAVLRWRPGETRVDTAGWVRGPQTSVSSTPPSGAGGGGVRITMGSAVVWSPQDAWGVAADGRVARVRPAPYQVTWYSGPRSSRAGPAVPYTPIRVTEADKREWREQQAANPPTMVMMGGPAGGGGGARTVAPSSLPEPTFAETKPPFTGQAGVLVSPAGEVWVLRTRPANDRVPVYDVFDESGRLMRKVSLPRESRVAGFGRGSVYVVRTDEDGLEYLQRYAWVRGEP